MIVVESPGMQTTVQDFGRPGYGTLGISPSGAADKTSLAIANAMVENPRGAPALEMTITGGRYRFRSASLAAVAGAPCTLRVNGEVVPHSTQIELTPGSVLEVGNMTAGARAYLAVRGGIDVPLWLGSASTHLLSGLGGFEGRALRKNDRLAVGSLAPDRSPCRLVFAARKTLRITPSTQTDWFDRAALTARPYRVSTEANRMGLRLEGPPLASLRPQIMLTEGAPLGAIQVPASGQPIVLFVEQQTTGGYPKIASIVREDIDSVGQLRPGDEIRFEWVEP